MSPNIVTATGKVVISQHVFAEVLQDKATNQKSLHVTVSIPPNAVICTFAAGSVQNQASYLTIQTGIGEHITLLPDFLQYTNHSCEPSAFFNTATGELVSLKALQPGDELTFFYPSTEWDMAQPFVCNCGSRDCLQLISGAAHLSVTTLHRYKLTDFIQQQLRQQSSL